MTLALYLLGIVIAYPYVTLETEQPPPAPKRHIVLIVAAIWPALAVWIVISYAKHWTRGNQP